MIFATKIKDKGEFLNYIDFSDEDYFLLKIIVVTHL